MINTMFSMIAKCKVLAAALFVLVLAGCAHPIVISPTRSVNVENATLVKKNVAYVMTDADRNKQVETPGGGGDRISYFPYRDLEKAIRDALRSIYADVYVIKSQNDIEIIKDKDISYVFAPEISTTSSSESFLTWPPTSFSIEMACNVTDASGNIITRLRVIGTGNAEFSEFKNDFGLAGRRAADMLSERLSTEVKNNIKLK